MRFIAKSMNTIDVVMVYGGSFQMGNDEGKENEQPIYKITVSDYYIGKYEVTQEQWKAVIGADPSCFNRDSLPVENVSKVNLAYKLPDEFDCDAPYGAEVLQAFTRTGKFDHLKVKESSGYQVITEGLLKILASTRGFNKAKQHLLQTETRMIVTTMEK